jgi:hypothetical protein
MQVKGSDHEDLGHVVRIDERGLIIDKGRYFTQEYRVLHEEIIRVDDDSVVVAQHRPEVAEAAGIAKKPSRRRSRRAS